MSKENNPQVYVSTYKKYNEGSLKGKWVDLTTYSDYNSFIAACKEQHNDEEYPELMIQDTQYLPDGLDLSESISEEEFNDIITAWKEEQEKSKQEEDDNISIIDYSEKAIAVIGNTKAIKEQLKNLGGKFNRNLKCGAGWIFNIKKKDDVQSLLNGAIITKLDDVTNNEHIAVINELKDYYHQVEKDERMCDYYIKGIGGAFKLDNGKICPIKKPRIETRFCFSMDVNGIPDAEKEKEAYRMLDVSRKSYSYFKERNLRELNIRIERAENKNYELVFDYNQHNLANYYLINDYGNDYVSMYLNSDHHKGSEQERERLIKELKRVRSEFEKRLDKYLNRYGLSKVHSWTYYSD